MAIIKEDLSSKDIIQIDATIITGALILLSISNILPVYQPILNRELPEDLGVSVDDLASILDSLQIARSEYSQAEYRLLISSLTLVVLAPFITSVVFCVTKHNRLAVYTMIGGFGIILFGLGIIVYINQTDLGSKQELVRVRENQFNAQLAVFDLKINEYLESISNRLLSSLNQTEVSGASLNGSSTIPVSNLSAVYDAYLNGSSTIPVSNQTEVSGASLNDDFTRLNNLLTSLSNQSADLENTPNTK
jgi:hypothetical protein